MPDNAVGRQGGGTPIDPDGGDGFPGLPDPIVGRQGGGSAPDPDGSGGYGIDLPGDIFGRQGGGNAPDPDGSGGDVPGIEFPSGYSRSGSGFDAVDDFIIGRQGSGSYPGAPGGMYAAIAAYAPAMAPVEPDGDKTSGDKPVDGTDISVDDPAYEKKKYETEKTVAEVVAEGEIHGGRQGGGFERPDGVASGATAAGEGGDERSIRLAMDVAETAGMKVDPAELADDKYTDQLAEIDSGIDSLTDTTYDVVVQTVAAGLPPDATLSDLLDEIIKLINQGGGRQGAG
jgi:hypothetical protein